MPAAADGGAARPGFLAARDIAEAGYIYGLPIVMNYGVMYEFVVDKTSGQYKGAVNTIVNEGRVFTYKHTAVVTPNSDTPYPLLWLDLRAEPVVISVPAVEPKRYYSVQMTDGNTCTFGYVGSRATGNEAGAYMIAGPGWSGATPDGIRAVFLSSTDFSLVIFRTQLFAPDDVDTVRAIQAQYAAKPLSAFLGQPAPAAAPRSTSRSSPRIWRRRISSNSLTSRCTSRPPNRTRPGSATGWPASVSAPARPSTSATCRSGRGSRRTAGRQAQGRCRGNRDRHEDQRLVSGFGLRRCRLLSWRLAAACSGGAGGHLWQYRGRGDVPPLTRWEADGTMLDGSKHAYTLTFAKGQLPPVNAFWSITMYDGKTQLLIENPINRYLINAPMLPGLQTNADGALTLYIQDDTPGPDREANWLPAPAGPIDVVMRLYWPRTEAPWILPAGTGTWQPPAVVRAS